MSKEETLKAIHHEGMKEFLERGFLEASLRNIAKRAGVTTGAFYGYYGSKEELFSKLVKTQYDTLINKYKEAHEVFRNLPAEKQILHMGQISGECLSWMTDYIYDNFDAFRLILCCSEGTKYADLVHEMSELEVRATHEFINTLKTKGREVPETDSTLEHILISGMLSAFFETVRHDIPREKALCFVESLKAFYLAGWRELMHIYKEE